MGIEMKRIAGIAATFIALTMVAGTCAAQVTVGYAGFGGTTQEAMMKALFADADKLGIKIKEDRSGGWPGIKAYLQSGATGWDLTDTGFAHCEQAAQADLVQPIDYSIVDKSQIPPNLAHAKYVGFGSFSYGIAYQKKKYGNNPPKDWADFFDPAKFPGRRSMLGEGLFVLEAALLADGVSPGNVYTVLKTPAGQDRAFAKLEKLKPDVAVWWRSPGQAVQLLRDGEVDMIVIGNGRASQLVADGADIGYVWNQAFLDVACFIVPKNVANPKPAMQLINAALNAESQGKFTALTGYGSVNPKAFESVALKGKDLSWFPTAPQNVGKQIWADPTWYASTDADAAYLRFSKFLQ
jgi:putative spermidine/putrescine transport system substrate-binding protein